MLCEVEWRGAFGAAKALFGRLGGAEALHRAL